MRQFARDVALFGASTLAPIGLDLAFVSPRRQWDQVVTLHDRVAGLHLSNLVPPTTILREFLTLDAGLTCIALAGILTVILARRFGDAMVLGLWMGGVLAMLFALSPALSAPCRHSFDLLRHQWRRRSRRTSESLHGRRTPLWLPLSLGGLAYLALLPRLARADLHILQAPPPSNVTILAAYVQRTTASSAFIAADNVRVAEQAHRLVPPSLCDPSNVRLLAGYMTARDLISATERYRAQLVVPLGNYIAVPAYIRWVKSHYRSVNVPGGGTVYRRMPST